MAMIQKVTLVSTALLYPLESNADTIDIAALDFCPYVCSDSLDNEPLGFVFEIEKMIFERAGHQVNLHVVPYVRSLKGTENGQYDAVAISNDTSSEVNICSNETIGPMIYTFYVKKGSPWRYDGVQSLHSITYGTIAGYDHTLLSQDVHKYYLANKGNKERIQIHHGTNDVHYRMLKRVSLGRIDTFAEASYVMDYSLRLYGLENDYQKAGQFENTLWGRMCFSPLNPKANEYVEIIDSGMKELRASGELENIMKKYGLEVWDPEVN